MYLLVERVGDCGRVGADRRELERASVRIILSRCDRGTAVSARHRCEHTGQHNESCVMCSSHILYGRGAGAYWGLCRGHLASEYPVNVPLMVVSALHWRL